jgi:hypothetical protein
MLHYEYRYINIYYCTAIRYIPLLMLHSKVSAHSSALSGSAIPT